IVLVLLPGGRFRMGSPEGAALSTAAEVPAHEIDLAPFLCSKFETTQGQWLRIAGTNPSRFRPDVYEETPLLDFDLTLAFPLTNVAHGEVVEAAARLELELPTEAQWEYAARGGTETAFWTGDAPRSVVVRRGGNTNASAWQNDTQLPFGDGAAIVTRVGAFAPNPFGLHDVIGNVCEWTLDRLCQYGGPVRAGDALREDA
ncbi:MAG: SUMF1/EgtB/PvdO family nonheme iron enzyme, partial [Planctomycetes bacterium]|nr:SUMF1/EgtB/PvdO family nonheme iron enzyme [Planctomycetota bacterium]